MGVFSGYVNADGGQVKGGVGLQSDQLLPQTPDYKDMELEEVKVENILWVKKLEAYLLGLKDGLNAIATAVNEPSQNPGTEEIPNHDPRSLVRLFDSGRCGTTISSVLRENSWARASYAGTAPYDTISPDSNRYFIVGDIEGAPVNEGAHWIARENPATGLPASTYSTFSHFYIDRLVNLGTLNIPVYISCSDNGGVYYIRINGASPFFFDDTANVSVPPAVRQLHNIAFGTSAPFVLGRNVIELAYGDWVLPQVACRGVLVEWGKPSW